MTKKITISLSTIAILILILDNFIHFISPFINYNISILILIFGIFIYPINTDFKSIKDFLIIPIITAVLFNLLNLFLIKNYSLKLNFANILMGIFCILQFFYYKKNFILKAMAFTKVRKEYENL